VTASKKLHGNAHSFVNSKFTPIYTPIPYKNIQNYTNQRYKSSSIKRAVKTLEALILLGFLEKEKQE